MNVNMFVYSTRAALDSVPHPLPIWLTSVSQQLLLRSALEWSRFQFQWGWEKCPNELLPPWHCTGWSKLLLLLPPFVFLRLPEFKETPPMTLSSRVFTMCAPPSMLCPKSIRVLHIIAPSRTGWLAFNPQTLWVLGVLLTWVWPSTDA